MCFAGVLFISLFQKRGAASSLSVELLEGHLMRKINKIPHDYVVRFYYYRDCRLASVSEGGAGPHFIPFDSIDKARDHYLSLKEDYSGEIATASLLDNRDL